MESGGKKRKLVDSLFMTPLQKKKKLQEQISADNKISIEGVAQSKAMKSSYENVAENKKMKNNFEIIPNMAPDIGEKSYHGEKSNSAREATTAHDQFRYVTEEVKAQERIDQIKEHFCSEGAEASNGGSSSDVSESDDVSSSYEADPLLSSSPYEEDDSDTEELVEQEMFWNAEQMEILQSAVPSFQFLPRTTTDKALEGCPYRVKYFARVWLERRDREGEDRLEVRRRKLKTVDHAQGTEPRVSKKVRFLV